MTTFREMAQSICDWVYTDSMIRLDCEELQCMLEGDSAVTGAQPLDDEGCATFVMGEAESGAVPDVMQKQFPDTHRYLDELF